MFAAVRSNFWTLRPPYEAAGEHRGAHHQQDVAQDRADQRCLDDLLEPGVQGEQGDDQLRRVAEGDVQEAADAGPGLGGDLLGRAAHQRGGRDHSERRREEDQARGGVGELERDRQRDERDEQVRPPVRARRRTSGSGRVRALPPPLPDWTPPRELTRRRYPGARLLEQRGALLERRGPAPSAGTRGRPAMRRCWDPPARWPEARSRWSRCRPPSAEPIPPRAEGSTPS